MNPSDPSSPDLFQKLFEGMEDGCAICRMVFEGDEPVDWIYLAVNPAFIALTGLREVVGRRITELLPGIRETSKDLFTIYGRVASTGRPEQVETFVKALDAWLSLQLFSPGPGQFIAIFKDITKLKAAEAEQARLEQRFFEAQKMESLGFLVAGVAHNINNVLAVALGTASMGEQLAADPRNREAYRSIGRVCMRGRDVVRSLIQFSKPTLSAQAPFELHALIQDVKALLDNTTGNRIQNLAALLPEPVWLQGDAGSFNLALMNLCLNAVDAMADGGTLSLRTASPGEGWVEVSIEDSGRGMTAEVMAHALEPFFTTKEVPLGSGLGLSVAYGVIKAHGGTLELASQPERGTTVTLKLPRIPAPVQDGTVRAPAPPPALGHVLLVDDDDDVRILMVRMLRKAGVAQVEAAAGGEEAMALLGSGPVPDLVILDQNMPGMSGVQLLGLIRDLHPGLPVLFSSGQPDIEDWECLKVPGVAVISKPFTIEEIQAKLADFGQSR